MEETEIGEKSKGDIFQVNVSEVSDIIVHCNVVFNYSPNDYPNII
ncbi:4976_t:CDS:2 [Entrophospora sp. SA101]|nr:4976_t:CDS:2 [Entrophospora sp. SA101]